MNKKIKLFGIQIDQLTMSQTVAKIAEWVQADEVNGHYVVTPNVDHIVNLDTNAAFKEAYDHASLIVADGRPVVLASRLLGKALPEVVPGSDLVPAIFDYYQDGLNKPLKVFLLGAMPGVAETAAENVKLKWPNVDVVGCYSPQFGFDVSEEMSAEIYHIVSQQKPDVVVFGVGAPKQELWSHRYASKLNTKVVLCVGATIDFLAGEKPRAPAWMRKVGIEWLHRMCSEPKRLVKRYFVGALTFPMLVYKEWKKS